MRVKRHRSVGQRAVALATLLSFVVGSCGGRSKPPATVKSPLSDQVLLHSKDLPAGLDMHVSEGTRGPEAFDRPKLAAATKLRDAEAQALLARGKPIASEPVDKQPFALRDRSQPPPRTGQTIKG